MKICKKQQPICLEVDGQITTLKITMRSRGMASLLAPYIYRTEDTIIRDILRRPFSLPEPELYGGTKKIWDTQKVLDWLPPGVRAAIIREFTNKNGEVQKANQPPPIKTLAEELELANSKITGNERQTSKKGVKKSGSI